MQIDRMARTARIIDKSGERELAPDDVQKERDALLAGNGFVVDGSQSPAFFRRSTMSGHPDVGLPPDEFEALAKLLRSPHVGFRPKDVFPGAASDDAAQRHFEKLRKKIAPNDWPDLGFITRDRGANLRYMFDPPVTVDYALIESVEVDPPKPNEPTVDDYLLGRAFCPACGLCPHTNKYRWNEGEHHDSIAIAEQQWRANVLAHHKR